MRQYKKIGLLILIIAGIFFYSMLLYHLRISITDSEKHHFFWKKNRCDFKRGEIVAAKMPLNDPFFPDPQHFLLVKEIACLPGEYVIRDGYYFYCYSPGKVDFFLGTSLKKAYNGKPLPQWYPSGKKIRFNGKYVTALKIPEGYFYLRGKAVRSYDSRYLGLFKKSQIAYCLKALF